VDGPILIIVAVVAVVLVVVGLVMWQRSSRPAEDTRVAAPPVRYGMGPAIRRALGTELDDATWEDIETALLAADVGVESTTSIITSVKRSRPETVEGARIAIRDALRDELVQVDRSLDLTGSPASIVVVGVNGTGKTTTIAKLAKLFSDEGKTVTMGAADTFRAAAGQQLETWAARVGSQVVRGLEGGDPASVVYDTLESARAKGVDVVIIDTAGRLHGKKNLMAELQKIYRVAGGDDVSEVLLVLDATAGQNGLAQVREFSNAVPISGIVLTKLDGTAKGGIIVAIERTLGVPVKLVGDGEGVDDLFVFDPDGFVDSLVE
jgi:fused signal recognition particle receptor